MRKIVLSDEIKKMEAEIINNLGVPSLSLMERAASSVLDVILEKTNNARKMVILCGQGNNAGDGFALARIAIEYDFDVKIVFAGNMDKMSSECAVCFDICRKMGISITDDITSASYILKDSDIIVDALFGIGLSRSVTGFYYDLIAIANDIKSSDSHRVTKFSVDIPSGLGSDSGKVFGIAFEADYTVTLGIEKAGLYLNDGPLYCGEVILKRIGITGDNYNNCYTLDESDIKAISPVSILANKSSKGKVLCITGSKNMPGASILSARAALRAGAGMVKIFTEESNRDLIIHEIPEAMVSTFNQDIDNDKLKEMLKENLKWCDCALIGCGLSTSDDAKKLVLNTLELCEKTLVIDADALNLIGLYDELFNRLIFRAENGFATVLTPHPMEYSRVFKTDIKDKDNQDILSVMENAFKSGVNLAAKDARTIVSDGHKVYINTVTDNALATAGSGDVYAGIISALISNNDESLETVAIATLLHGLCGKKAASLHGSRSVNASDIIDALEDIFIENNL